MACTPEQQAALGSASPLGLPSQTAVPTPTATATLAAAATTPTPTQTAAATTAPTETPAPTPQPTPEPTPPPTPQPTPRPTPVPTPVPTPQPTPPPTPSPTPTPTPTPSPSPTGVPGGLTPATGPVPQGFVRYGGFVVDATTGAPIPGVCVYSGPPAGCPIQGTPRTDAQGYFAIDYPQGAQFTWTFEHPQYRGLLNQTITGNTQTFRLTHL